MADASGIADFVGPDKSGVLYDTSQRMLLMSQIGSELVKATDKAAAWKQIHDVSSWRPTDGLPGGVGRKEHLVRWMVSNELLSEQSLHGDDEALKLAGRYAALPTLRNTKDRN